MLDLSRNSSDASRRERTVRRESAWRPLLATCAEIAESRDFESQDPEQEEEVTEEWQHEERVLIPSDGTVREIWRC